MSIELFYTGIVQGLVLAIIAFGVMIPFRLLDFPDLTVDGAYPLGGAICASLLIAEIQPVFAVIIGALLSGLLAVITAQVALRMRINSLLAGIIVSTMAYSINLRVMGKPNVALFNIDGLDLDIISLIMVLFSCIILFFFFLHTDFGLRFRAVGMNQDFSKAHDISINKYISIGLFIAGAMFGLAGSLMVQLQQFMDVGMGVGIVIHGLASLMIGESLVDKRTIKRQLIAPVVGALIYQQIQGVVLSFGLSPSDLKFFTGAVVLSVLSLQKVRANATG